MGDLMRWVIAELSAILQFPVTEDMANCILLIESNRDLEEYLNTLLDMSNPIHQKFIKDLKQKKQMLMANAHGYKKAELDNYIQSKPLEKKKKGNKNKQEVRKNNDPPEESSHSTKSKNKFVNILSQEMDTVLLKGRHVCNCQATKHPLVNNCLKCGRIVCQQEGPGTCLFCGNLVTGKNDDSGKQKQYTFNSKTDKLNSSLESALELRDRLLEYDRTSEKRTHVIDDESDYFSTDSVWLTKEQREKFKKKVEELHALKNSRGKHQLRVDFMGRFVVEDESISRSLNQEEILLEEITEMFSESQISQEGDIDPKSTISIHPVYSGGGRLQTGAKWHNVIGRVQDSQVMEMTDSGMCLSMHQPWALLLILGIKEHEGRSWYTSHRGRLWIAAASRVPTSEEIKDIEDQYRLIKGEDIKLPSRYPTGCLLGCVNLVDCLPQEEYRDKFPQGESDSPFVFICSHPIKCPVMFPMQGKHKIYKMDSKIHQAASKCIQKISSTGPP